MKINRIDLEQTGLDASRVYNIEKNGALLCSFSWNQKLGYWTDLKHPTVTRSGVWVVEALYMLNKRGFGDIVSRIPVPSGPTNVARLMAYMASGARACVPTFTDRAADKDEETGYVPAELAMGCL